MTNNQPLDVDVQPDASLTTKALIEFFSRFQAHTPQPIADYDPKWPSPCVTHVQMSKTQCEWQPQLRTNKTVSLDGDDVFARIETAIESTLHPDIIDYYASFWSDHIDAFYDENGISLIFPWSHEDLEGLRQNFLGHYLQQRRRKLPITFFFACVADDNDLMISIDNTSGAVVLEKIGKRPQETLANSIAEFLDQLTFTPQ